MRLILFIFLITLSFKAVSDPLFWDKEAKKICAQLNQAFVFYKNNDIKKARSLALMSYFKLYDAEMEPAVRITQGGPHVFEIEQQFRDYAQAMTPKPSPQKLQEVHKIAKQLCTALSADAKVLDASHTPARVFEET